MKKPWSISTTVRNPERLRGFLKVLKESEGESFGSENQIKYQILLIKNKLYKPTDLTKEQESYFDDIEKEMPFAVAERIFHNQHYEDPAMRGRNSVAPLNKMGFCIAKNSAEQIKITSLGKLLLSEDYDLGNVFFIHFLKWQLPNPDSKTFSEDDGFNIKPFVGTLHLINEVNKRWESLGNKPVGITKEEFSLFVPTLIDHKNIGKQADAVVDFRDGLRKIKDEKEKRKYREKYKKNFAKKFLKTKSVREVELLLNNLKDYGDNAIRYFRLTRYIHIRGGGFHIDLEPRREIEIKALLKSDNASPIVFENVEKYLSYISDINEPTLPWETEDNLIKIATKLERDNKEYLDALVSEGAKVPIFSFKDIGVLNIDQLKKYIEDLRLYRRELQNIEIHDESQDLDKVREYIDLLKNIYQSESKKSIELERLATLALNALNDAIDIKPNYPVGDDNEPTFTAPANKPDIECFYEKFNSVCEVTMLVSRDQWYNEGQPVMRHLRDFENSHSNKNTYCLFIAPKLHQDTVETFWMAIKYGYKGTEQRIIPLSINQLVKMLDTLLKVKESGKLFKHSELLELYNDVVEITGRVSNSEEWLEEIPQVINSWQKSILSKA
ncbi:MAG TPA: AlwI family type II restriction endonuclease [Patescibacteria group bacterium]|nr:AlwI family type II restriction endonuclease [Patescibacteria group bacterium]